MELKRPQKKTETSPLTEEDRYRFFPYVLDDFSVLPSQAGTWKTDEKAVAFLKALDNGEDLRGTDWTGVNLKGADLSGKNLDGIILSKANLTGANFKGANLENVDLSYAYMENTDLTEACLKGANFKGVFFRDCRLDGAEVDKESLSYLQSIEFFIEQIEAGKIDLRQIPQDQLNYLDLRVIDLSKVNIQDVDLSALVLDGVNLSGVRVDRKHLLNIALMEKIQNKILVSEKKFQKAAKAMLQKIFFERKEQMRQYSLEEKKKKQVVRDYADSLKRPKHKESTDVISDEWDQEDDTQMTNEQKSEQSVRSPRSLSSQGKKVKLTRNTKKRT